MKLNIPQDCGNSPKRELIKDLTIYFASYDLEKVEGFLDENMVWTLVGNQPITGKQKFLSALETMKRNKVLELTIHSVITHGKEAAVHGEMSLENGSILGFSDFYEFTSASGKKVKSIVSFVVDQKKPSQTNV